MKLTITNASLPEPFNTVERQSRPGECASKFLRRVRKEFAPHKEDAAKFKAVLTTTEEVELFLK